VPATIEAGEDEVMACVVTKPGADPGEIWAFCSRRVPAFAVPRFIRIMSRLPKTPSERVQKTELRREGITADTYDHLEE
jgi:carnitine-CoA ligase